MVGVLGILRHYAIFKNMYNLGLMQSIATLLTGFVGTIVAVDKINILLLGTVRKRILRAILLLFELTLFNGLNYAYLVHVWSWDFEWNNLLSRGFTSAFCTRFDHHSSLCFRLVTDARVLDVWVPSKSIYT